MFAPLRTLPWLTLLSCNYNTDSISRIEPSSGRSAAAIVAAARTRFVSALPHEAYRVELAHRGDVHLGLRAADPFTLESDGVRIGVRLHSARPVAAEQVNGMVVYPNALTGADAMQRVSAEGTEDYLVLNQAPDRAQLYY